MGLNETMSSERVHIGFFGNRNAGKSSLVNAVTGQSLSVVSDVLGTTTDPVKKAMEILPLGPVVIIDTPGLDDVGELGALRVKKSHEALDQCDIAILVVDASVGITDSELKLLDVFKAKSVPYIIAVNKIDLCDPENVELGVKKTVEASPDVIYVSASTGEGINELKERIGKMAPKKDMEKRIVADLLEPGDVVVLVIPIDESAPKGRIILPQQQVLRELLDYNCTAVVCQDTELAATLDKLSAPPRLVITDSQVFGKVDKIVPQDVELTSFSILFARYKGMLGTLMKGAEKLMQLKDTDKVLISEGCTHHRQCADIGTVKIPGWIKQFVGAEPKFSYSSGNEFSDDLSQYDLIIHCGACMLNEAAMHSRIEKANAAGVPMVNYGVAIAKMHGILERSTAPVIK